MFHFFCINVVTSNEKLEIVNRISTRVCTGCQIGAVATIPDHLRNLISTRSLLQERLAEDEIEYCAVSQERKELEGQLKQSTGPTKRKLEAVFREIGCDHRIWYQELTGNQIRRLLRPGNIRKVLEVFPDSNEVRMVSKVLEELTFLMSQSDNSNKTDALIDEIEKSINRLVSVLRDLHPHSGVILKLHLLTAHLVSFSIDSNLRWVPPLTHEWKSSNIPKNIKVHWENQWAKASYLKGCTEENSLMIIPVYFWPGERVDLPCRMCEMAYLMNGRMKRWGYSEQVDEFLLNPTQFVRVNEIWQDVQNTQNFTENNDDDVNLDDVIWYPHTVVPEGKKSTSVLGKDEHLYIRRFKEPPRYWQNDGKLTIFSADVRSQGVYFCYDEMSRKQTVLFFVLMAMLPPVRFTTKHPLDYTDHCGHEQGENSEMIFPSHNWRFHFLPMGDFIPPPTCQLDENDYEGCKHKYPYLDSSKWPKNFGEDCSMDRCRARLFSPDNNIDLYIELRWDEWTSCKGDQPTKRREAHCYLVRGEGSINIESMKSEHKKLYLWVKNVETVFDRKPFDVDGVRLHSSLLTSAIFDKPKITGCYNKKDEEEGKYKKYNQVWRKVFLPTLGVPETGEEIQLGNPFEACIRFTRLSFKEGEEPKSEHMIGTFSTQVDYC